MMSQTYLFPGRVLCWFSCGAASAVAAKLTVEKYGRPEVIYCDTSKDEHADNARFMKDVEAWVGIGVTTLSSNFSSVEDVFERYRYMSGPAGARCTAEMKKRPRFTYQHPEDVHVFGLTADEGSRIKQFEENNPELRLDWVLRDAGLTKPDCMKIISDAGIKLPAMYALGYANNNCKGCVKASSPAYWNKVRQDFPEVFARRAEQSRRFNCRLVRYKGERIFLDELPPNASEVVVEDLSCGPQCAATQEGAP